MSDVLSISLEGMRSDDIKRIRRALDMSLRNAEIRLRYAELQARYGQLQALMQLEEDTGLCQTQLRRIIYTRCNPR